MTALPGTSAHQVGDVHRFDFQADVWRGRYQLTERHDDGSWTCTRLDDDDEIIDAILASDDPYCGGADEVLRRIELNAECPTIRMRFVSRDQYARHF